MMLKDWREKKGYTLQEAADITGLSLSTYWRCENKPQDTKASTLERLRQTDGLKRLRYDLETGYLVIGSQS